MKDGGKKSWHWILPGAVLLLVLGVVLPPLVNIGRYQRKIAASIADSIGRPVHMSTVSLRLLPLPALKLSGFLVEERPEFGNEPILRADSVVAYPRMISLWRGKLEIARIHFDNASLNLVRARDGSWNFASILVQAAHRPEAPTGQRHPGAAPRFPYIEATNSRINFKAGNEKTPLSFLNSDLSVWLNHPDEWELHFRAQPARTDLDLDLADTGILRIDGTLHRAATLAEMPLKLKVEWTAAPLGQFSRLTIGKDSGWRGNVDVQAEINGPAGFAQIKTLLKVAELHRTEFAPAQPLNLNASCRASYHNASTSLENVACSSTIGGGDLALNGYLRNLQTRPKIGLALNIHRVPASAVLSGLQEVRNGLGEDLRAAGTLNGRFLYFSSGRRPPSLSGEMGMSSLTLISRDSGKSLLLEPVRLTLENRSVLAAGRAAIFLPPPALLLQPIRLSLGTPAPLTIAGRFTLGGFDLHLSGTAALARLRGLSGVLAWPGADHSSTARLGATGTAIMDFNLRGPWLLPVPEPEYSTAPDVAVGSIALRNAELIAPYLSQPLKIASAQGVLGPAEIAWTDASIRYGSLEAEGSLEYPTLCLPGNSCAGHFQLAAPALDIGELQSALLGAPQRGELLRAILDRIGRRPAAWPRLTGTIGVGALSLGKLVLHDATGDLEISGKSMKILALNGRLLNGAALLNGALDATGDQPNYELDVRVAGASPSALAALLGERWGSGVAGFSARLKMSGFAARDLADSATGALHWNWSKRTLAPQIAHSSAIQAFLRFDDWNGDAVVEDRTIRIEHSLLARGAQAIPLSGTISFDRKLDLNGGAGLHAFSVTGTLAHPRVSGKQGAGNRK